MNKGISVVLPAYNEEKNIRSMVNICLRYLKKIKDKNEIIIVNDGSTDNSPLIAHKLALKSPSVRLINHPRNLGYGQALKTGFEAAKFDYLFYTDADRQFRLDALDIMLPIIKIKGVDIVIGYRLHRQDPAFRRLLSWGYNTLASFLFDINVKDIDCAFKLFDKKIFKKIKIESSSFFFNTEILAKARYYKFNIIEVGVPHFPRTAGKSTVKIKHIPLTIKELIRIRRGLNKLKKQNENFAG